MAGPDDPIAAVRVESAAAAPLGAEVVPAAAAAPVAAAAAAPATAEPAAIELVGERPSLLETVGKEAVAEKPAAEAKPAEKPAAEAKPAEKPAVEPEKPAEAKPAEAKPDAPKPEDAKPAEAAKPEPLAAVDYKYELPATLKLDDALKGDLHTALDAFRANPADGVQPLIDLHNRIVTDLVTQNADATLRDQHKSFNDTRTQWNKDWAADEQIGGAGYQTALRAVARMRDQFVSAELPGTPRYEADRKSFEEFLRVTGAGDHPAFGRFLHNVARAFDEPALPPTNGKPAPNNGMKPGSRRERMYDHPSSSKTS